MIEIERKTTETRVKVALNTQGNGTFSIDTPIGFLNHMLETLAKHSLMDITIEAEGDTNVDYHHTVEDIGIVLGEALLKSLKETKSNIQRFGFSVIPMDDALVLSSVDMCNRVYINMDVNLNGVVGNFDCELVEEFFRAFVSNARIVLHVKQLSGFNKHHICEAVFKSVAHSLRMALSPSDTKKSTKGLLY